MSSNLGERARAGRTVTSNPSSRPPNSRRPGGRWPGSPSRSTWSSWTARSPATGRATSGQQKAPRGRASRYDRGPGGHCGRGGRHHGRCCGGSDAVRGGDVSLPESRLRRDERRGGLQAPQRPLRRGTPAGSRPRGAQREARDVPRADGPKNRASQPPKRSQTTIGKRVRPTIPALLPVSTRVRVRNFLGASPIDVEGKRVDPTPKRASRKLKLRDLYLPRTLITGGILRFA